MPLTFLVKIGENETVVGLKDEIKKDTAKHSPLLTRMAELMTPPTNRPGSSVVERPSWNGDVPGSIVESIMDIHLENLHKYEDESAWEL